MLLGGATTMNTFIMHLALKKSLLSLYVQTIPWKRFKECPVEVDIFHSKMSRTAIIHQTFAVAIISTFSIVHYMADKSTRQVITVNKNPEKGSFKRCLTFVCYVLRLIRKAHMIESYLYNNSIRKEHFTNILLKRLDRKLKTRGR